MSHLKSINYRHLLESLCCKDERKEAMKPLLYEDKNNPPEIRAYIYQQLTELESIMPQGSAVSITVDDKNLLKNTKSVPAKKVVIYLETPVGNLLSEAKHKNVFTAIKKAKEALKMQLMTLQGVLVPADVRANQIETIIKHPYLH